MMAVDPIGASCSTNVNVCVISACDAVVKTIALVDGSALSRKDKRPLVSMLKSACVAFDQGQFVGAMNVLEAFQHKVAGQLEKNDPATAAAFTASVQAILEAIDCEARLVGGQ